MKRTLASLIGIAIVALLATGCGEENGVTPTPSGTVGLTVAFDMSLPNVTVPDDDNIYTQSRPATSPDSVTITSGLLMVRSIRLNQTVDNSVDTVITAADENRDLGDASVRFQGPYIVTIDGSSYDLGTTTIPQDDYRQMTFVLQKARVTDMLNGHDELIGSSLSVTGKIWRNGDGRTFTFNTDYTSEFAITGDFNVNTTNAGTLTVEFAPRQWFHTGSHWLDPNDSSNRLQIVNNIRRTVSGSLSPVN